LGWNGWHSLYDTSRCEAGCCVRRDP
jgi:hypothetical protein